MRAWSKGLLLLSMVVGLSGCLGLLGQVKLTPGKETIEQAMEALQEQAKAFEPTQINGTCKLGYRDEDGKWRKMPSFNMRVWLEPPYNLCLVGSAAPGPEGKISLGANQASFWLSIKPEINTYWYGEWDDMSDATALELNPKVVLESLGMIQFMPYETWQLEKKKGMDVLTCKDAANARMIKRLFVRTKTYHLEKIVYYDGYDEPTVVVDLERYEVLDGQNSVPTGIRVTRYTEGNREGSVIFNLNQGTIRQFKESNRSMFQPAAPKGYDQVIHVTRFGAIRE